MKGQPGTVAFTAQRVANPPNLPVVFLHFEVDSPIVSSLRSSTSKPVFVLYTHILRIDTAPMRLLLRTLLLVALYCSAASALASPTPHDLRSSTPSPTHGELKSLFEVSQRATEYPDSDLLVRSPCQWLGRLKDKVKACFIGERGRGPPRIAVNNYGTEQLMILDQHAHDADHGRIGVVAMGSPYRSRSRRTIVHPFGNRFEPPRQQQE
jgi:hypothetical protein